MLDLNFYHPQENSKTVFFNVDLTINISLAKWSVDT